MRSTFFGLTIGYSGLAAQQRALDVTSHNIANANTPGFSRQSVIMEPAMPIKVLQGYVGTGVEITEFRRIRDEFLDIQLRTENKSLGEWETKSMILSNLEVIFNEPSEYSLRSVMDAFWEGWNLLSKNPESVAVRDSVIQGGITLVDTFNHIARQLADQQEDINKGISIKIDEVNSIARQIRDLNYQIVKAEADGSKANDLRDRRDHLVEQLAKIVDINVVENQVGAINVTIGGRSLVTGNYVTEIKFIANDEDPSASKIIWVDTISGSELGPVTIRSGQLKGYLDMRDDMVPKLQQQISELARRIATEVNELHRQGYVADGVHGGDFFVKLDNNKPFSAANIAVNQAIIDNNTLLAAAAESPVLKGDGENALRIFQLRSKAAINPGVFNPPQTVTGAALTAPITIDSSNNTLNITLNGTTKTITLTENTYGSLTDIATELQNRINDPANFGAGAVSVSVDGFGQLVITNNLPGAYRGIYEISGSAATALGIATKYEATFDDYFRSTVAQLGVASQEAERMVENQNLLVAQLINRREEVSGVSLDEEMTNMIRFQHAYAAAARVITANDEMLDLIVNRLGLVGR